MMAMQGVGAGVQQIVVAEGAQRHVLRPAGTEGQAPGLFAPVWTKMGSSSTGHLPGCGPGGSGRPAGPAPPRSVQAAGQQGNAVDGCSASSREKGSGTAMDWSRFSHAQHGALAGAGRRHRQAAPAVAGPGGLAQDSIFLGFSCKFTIFASLSLLMTRLVNPWYRSLPAPNGVGPGRHSITSVSSGVASMRTGKRLPLASNRPSPRGTGQKPPLQLHRQVEGFAHGADSGGVLLEQQLEGGVLQAAPGRNVSGDGAGGVLGEEVLHVLGDELQPQPVLAGPFRHADHEGRALRVLHDAPHLVHHQQAGSRGSWAAAAHTVSVQTIAAAGLEVQVPTDAGRTP